MSPEYTFVVNVHVKDDATADRVQDALSMVKGVIGVRLNETLAMPSDSYTTSLYLKKLNSLPDSAVVTSRWLRDELPGLTKSDLRGWLRDGYISASLPYPGRGCSRIYTIEEARAIGQMWEAKARGVPARVALQPLLGNPAA